MTDARSRCIHTPSTGSSGAISSRPSLSYSRRMARLQQNKRAIFSLYLIIGLLAFTFIGPMIWTVDPSSQDVDQISIALGRRSLRDLSEATMSLGTANLVKTLWQMIML